MAAQALSSPPAFQHASFSSYSDNPSDARSFVSQAAARYSPSHVAPPAPGATSGQPPAPVHTSLGSPSITVAADGEGFADFGEFEGAPAASKAALVPAAQQPSAGSVSASKPATQALPPPAGYVASLCRSSLLSNRVLLILQQWLDHVCDD